MTRFIDTHRDQFGAWADLHGAQDRPVQLLRP